LFAKIKAKRAAKKACCPAPVATCCAPAPAPAPCCGVAAVPSYAPVRTAKVLTRVRTRVAYR
jgi:hypothetical protein